MQPDAIWELDRNEYFFEHPAAVLEALASAAKTAHRYTSSAEHLAFHNSVSRFLGVDPSHLRLGHGGEDLLVKLLAWHRRRHDTLVCLDFSWQTYFQIGQGLDYKLVEAPCIAEGNRFLTPQQALVTVLEQTPSALVIITSPNNPTGHSTSPELMGELAARFPNHVFIVDAVYDVPRSPFLNIAVEFTNVILLGSFSKFFGLPGIRVGYAVSRTLPEGMNLVLGLQPFAVRAAHEAMEHLDEYTTNRAEMLSFARTLLNLNTSSRGHLKIFETSAPFVLISTEKPLAQVESLLANAVNNHRVRPKIFSRRDNAWLRFGLGPSEVAKRTLAFLTDVRLSLKSC